MAVFRPLLKLLLLNQGYTHNQYRSVRCCVIVFTNRRTDRSGGMDNSWELAETVIYTRMKTIVYGITVHFLLCDLMLSAYLRQC
ncbi:hypothetical protein DICVIV_03908 [Dictyocaulus viviparus]|uniref:Secreted protein n=1 Tax=Dictyocaulus viviparus TaxID=29172 RepID=A0A0D8Y5W2_DICVI|nr:hypothetical protein DICVIV_03908 [Dictyocaulus viviparus]